MPTINMNIRTLKTVKETIENEDKVLINTNIPEVKNLLSEIKTNLNNMQGMDASLDRIISMFIDVSANLSFDLAKLETFLTTQINNYELTEEEAVEELNVIISKMSNFVALGGTLVPGSPAHSVLSAAKKLSDIMVKEQHTYSQKNLHYFDIESSLKDNKTCCATYVGAVLYESGLVSKDEINSVNYNYAPALYEHFKGKWENVSSIDNLEAGDVVFMTAGSDKGIGHVQIYAGNGQWYNAGSTNSIRRGLYSDSSQNFRFISALRPEKSS